MANSVIQGKRLSEAKSLAVSFDDLETTTNRVLDTVIYSVHTSGVTDNQGEFTVQHRVVVDKNTKSPWSTLTLSPQAVLNDADGDFTIVLDPAPIGELRLAFAAAGGAPDGTAEVWVSGSTKGGRT